MDGSFLLQDADTAQEPAVRPTSFAPPGTATRGGYGANGAAASDLAIASYGQVTCGRHGTNGVAAALDLAIVSYGQSTATRGGHGTNGAAAPDPAITSYGQRRVLRPRRSVPSPESMRWTNPQGSCHETHGGYDDGTAPHVQGGGMHNTDGAPTTLLHEPGTEMQEREEMLGWAKPRVHVCASRVRLCVCARVFEACWHSDFSRNVMIARSSLCGSAG